MLKLTILACLLITSGSNAYNKAENIDKLIDNTQECPVDWLYLNGRCLLFSHVQVNFAQALSGCANYSATLASIHTDAEAEAVFGFDTWADKNNNMLIGLHCPTKIQGDRYVNADGTQPDWSVWDSNNRRWGPCTITYSAQTNGDSTPKLWKVVCDEPNNGYICQIATDKWERLKSDLALKANAQVMQNYTTVVNELGNIRSELKEILQILKPKTKPIL